MVFTISLIVINCILIFTQYSRVFSNSSHSDYLTVKTTLLDRLKFKNCCAVKSFEVASLQHLLDVIY